MKTNDADWVEDVRRWYFNGGRPAAVSAQASPSRKNVPEASEIGYEAAHPTLQSPGWPKPAASGFGSLV